MLPPPDASDAAIVCDVRTLYFQGEAGQDRARVAACPRAEDEDEQLHAGAVSCTLRIKRRQMVHRFDVDNGRATPMFCLDLISVSVSLSILDSDIFLRSERGKSAVVHGDEKGMTCPAFGHQMCMAAYVKSTLHKLQKHASRSHPMIGPHDSHYFVAEIVIL